MVAKLTHCKDCGAEKGTVPWPMLPSGALKGGLCRACNRTHVKKRHHSPTGQIASQLYESRRRGTVEERISRSIASAASNSKRMKKDPLFAAICRTRCAVNQAFARASLAKNTQTGKMLGLSYEEFLAYLLKPLSLPVENGIPVGYVLDHIVPITVAFDNSSILRLNRYTNFQLLTEAANTAKSDVVPALGVRARDLTLEQKKVIISQMARV